MERRTVGGVVAASVLASALAGWAASSVIRSPSEAAARTRSPDPSTILIPVEERELASEVVTRGTARFGSPRELSLTPSALKLNTGVVTGLPIVGQEITEGSLVMLQSGRPVFLLSGELPAYRDLGPGLEGDDVKQLQSALGRLGFFSGEANGVYDDATEDAVAAWYRDAGFQPFEATKDQLGAIEAREIDLLSARLDVLSADDAVALAEADVTRSRAMRDAARRDVELGAGDVDAARAEAIANDEAAREELAAKQLALEEVQGDSGGPTTVAQARAELNAARAEANDVTTAGRAAVTAAKQAAAQAGRDLNQAEADLSRTLRDNDAAVKDARRQRDAVLDDPFSTQAEIDAAEEALATAEANAQASETAARQAVDDAQAVLVLADQFVIDEQARADAANVAAEARVASAQAALDSLMAGGSGGAPSQATIAAARSELAKARANVLTTSRAGARAVAEALSIANRAGAELSSAEASLRASNRILGNARSALGIRQRMSSSAAAGLSTTRREAGIQVPADELFVVPQAPIRIAELKVATGDTAIGPIMLATNATVAVDGSVPVAEAKLLKKGMKVYIDEPDLGIEAEGVVETVAETPGTNGVDGFHVYFEVVVPSSPANLPGTSVRLTLPVETSGGRSLVVPLAAVSLAPDGSSRVWVDRDGDLQAVTVEPGLSADGFVAVEPIEGSLRRGDLVEVGADTPGA